MAVLGNQIGTLRKWFHSCGSYKGQSDYHKALIVPNPADSVKLQQLQATMWGSQVERTVSTGVANAVHLANHYHWVRTLQLMMLL